MSMLMKRERDNSAMPIWRMAGFAFGAVSCVLYLAMLGLLGWYFWNVVGGGIAAAVIVGIVMAAWLAIMGRVSCRIVARTNGKFGKCRPFMVIGNALMLIAGALVVLLTHKLPDSAILRGIYFTVFAAVFAAGFAFQTVAYWTGRKCIPAGKKNRVLFAVFEIVLVLAGIALTAVLAQTFAAGSGGYSEIGFCTVSWNYLTWSALAAMILSVFCIASQDHYASYRD